MVGVVAELSRIVCGFFVLDILVLLLAKNPIRGTIVAVLGGLLIFNRSFDCVSNPSGSYFISRTCTKMPA